MSYINKSKTKSNKALYYNIKTSKNNNNNKETSAYNSDFF